MTDRINEIKAFIRQKKHHVYRKDTALDLAKDFANRGLTPMERMSERFVSVLGEETPIVFPFEKIALTRTIHGLPDIFTPEEWSGLKKKTLHEAGFVCNISPGYGDVIVNGLDYYRNKAVWNMKRGGFTEEQRSFFKAVVADIDAIRNFTDRYRTEAVKQNNRTVADLLAVLPRKGARSFHEALQMFRILHYMLWAEGEYHNTVGRFDQYMYPFFEKDIHNGNLTEEEAFELLEEFFLTFNRDSDLYTGVQQGDNGQSLVLGGVDRSGRHCFNRLSELCLLASKELKMIDPKINLRVDKDTPACVYEMGTELTKEGLGFPQYANDDVVIPGLTALGYELEDARDYVAAACWEFIIPKYGMDVPNIGALNYPKVIDRCLHKDLTAACGFEAFFSSVQDEIGIECHDMMKKTDGLWIIPAPFMSVFMNDCMETGNDISLGGKYNNYGFHGTGIATAADSLAAIRKLIFEEKSLSPEELIRAVDADFSGWGKLLNRLRTEMPKMGNNDDEVDSLAMRLMSRFAETLHGHRNSRGGCFRAGTGSAMYYLWHAGEIGASPDGRRAAEPYGANYAPSLFAKLDGPLSVIKSFVKPDYTKAINGGPLTMEFHDTLFRGQDSIGKIASLVAYFIRHGGHQFQLNAVNRDTLLDAQKHPENYENLIVRIWGWSAYFVELDKEYQDHVIMRQEYVT